VFREVRAGRWDGVFGNVFTPLFKGLDESRQQPYTLEIFLAVLALVNMRGVKDTGKAFIIPTFLFVGTLLTLIAVGVAKTFLAHGHPTSLATLPVPSPQTMSYLSIWLLMKAFSSGCVAMTGVEAVSNGVMAFGEPRTKNAQRTLTVIIGILMILLFGITWLAKKYPIMPWIRIHALFLRTSKELGSFPWTASALLLQADHLLTHRVIPPRDSEEKASDTPKNRRCFMRSDMVFRAEEQVVNKYKLCQAASLATWRLHIASRNTQETINSAFASIAAGLEMPVADILG